MMTPEKLKQARLRLGLTQRQAAVMLGYGSQTRVSEIETGRRQPSDAVLRLLEAYLAGYRPPDWPDY